MCNLYSMTKSQAAIREWIRAMRDTTGNLPPMPGIFPDMMAPIVRTGADGQRELVMARWGMPSPPKLVTGVDRGVTNIRPSASPMVAKTRQLKPELDSIGRRKRIGHLQQSIRRAVWAHPRATLSTVQLAAYCYARGQRLAHWQWLAIRRAAERYAARAGRVEDWRGRPIVWACEAEIGII